MLKRDNANYVQVFDSICRGAPTNAAEARSMVLFRTKGLLPAHLLVDAAKGCCLSLERVCANTRELVQQHKDWRWQQPTDLSTYATQMMGAEATAGQRWKCAVSKSEQQLIESLAKEHAQDVGEFRKQVMSRLEVLAIHLFTWDGKPRQVSEIKWALCHYSTKKQRIQEAIAITASIAGVVFLGTAVGMAIRYKHQTRQRPRRRVDDDATAPLGPGPPQNSLVPILYSRRNTNVRFGFKDLTAPYVSCRPLRMPSCPEWTPHLQFSDLPPSVRNAIVMYEENKAAYDNIAPRPPPHVEESKRDRETNLNHVPFPTFRQLLFCCMQDCLENIGVLRDSDPDRRRHVTEVVVFCKDKTLQNGHAWSSWLAIYQYAAKIDAVRLVDQTQEIMDLALTRLSNGVIVHYIFVFDEVYDKVKASFLDHIRLLAVRDPTYYVHIVSPYVGLDFLVSTAIDLADMELIKGRKQLLDLVMHEAKMQGKPEAQVERMALQLLAGPQIGDTLIQKLQGLPSALRYAQVLSRNNAEATQARITMKKYQSERFIIYAAVMMDRIIPSGRNVPVSTFYFDHAQPWYLSVPARGLLKNTWEAVYKQHQWKYGTYPVFDAWDDIKKEEFTPSL